MKNRSYRIAKWILLVLSIILVLSMIAVIAFFGAKLFLVDDDGGKVPVLDAERNDPDDIVENDVRINMLVMGKDQTSGLCDVLMLASYNVTDSSIGIVHIPRDTYARYTDSSYKKLNGAVSSLGGERAFCDFLEDVLCVRIDHYLTLELDAVGEIVDAIGGVDVNVPCDMDYEDPAQDLSIHIKKGINTLNGEMAKQFIRFRSGYATGDLGRIDAQKLFLAALLCKLRDGLSVIELGSVVAAVADDVKTSFPLAEVITLAKKALEVSPDKVSFVTLAGQSAVAKKSGASYYVVSRPSAIEIMNDFFGVDIKEEDFDKDKIFLNENYEEFEEIYYSSVEYTVFNAVTLGADK